MSIPLSSINVANVIAQKITPENNSSQKVQPQASVKHTPALNPVMNTIGQALQQAGLPAAVTGQSDLTSPLDIAKKILDHVHRSVNQAFQQGGQTSALQMFERANQGLADGFGQLNNERAGYQRFPGHHMPAHLQEVNQHLQGGMHELGNRHGFPDHPPSTSFVEQSQMTKVHQQQTIGLQIQTKDGDTITVNVSKKQGIETSQYQYSDPHQSVIKSSVSQYQQSGIEYRVEGDLSEDEQEAIDVLINNVGKLAKEYFDGDLEAAYQKSQSLGFDTEQISNFSANFSQRESRQQIATYKSIEQIRPPKERIELPENHNDLPKLADFFKHYEDVKAMMENYGMLFNPEEIVADTFKSILDLISQDEEKKPENQLKQAKDNLIGAIEQHFGSAQEKTDPIQSDDEKPAEIKRV